MNLPNLLTVFRIVLIPVFSLCYFSDLPKYVALEIYLVASFTDYLDGYIARKWNQITDFGKLMDPLADKLMVVTLMCCLAMTRDISWTLVIIMLIKELLMLAGSIVMLRKNVVVHSNMYGKVATFVMIAALAMVFPWHSVALMKTIGTALLYIAVALSIVAFFNYALVAYNNLKNSAA